MPETAHLTVALTERLLTGEEVEEVGVHQLKRHVHIPEVAQARRGQHALQADNLQPGAMAWQVRARKAGSEGVRRRVREGTS